MEARRQGIILPLRGRKNDGRATEDGRQLRGRASCGALSDAHPAAGFALGRVFLRCERRWPEVSDQYKSGRSQPGTLVHCSKLGLRNGEVELSMRQRLRSSYVQT